MGQEEVLAVEWGTGGRHNFGGYTKPAWDVQCCATLLVGKRHMSGIHLRL